MVHYIKQSALIWFFRACFIFQILPKLVLKSEALTYEPLISTWDER